MRTQQRSDNQLVNFDYEVGTEIFELKIAYIAENEMTQITKNSKKKNKDEMDWGKYNLSIIKKAIKGWEGMKRRHVRYLVEQNEIIILDPGESWDDDIEFSQEMLDWIARRANSRFGMFVVNAARDVNSIVEADQEREKANLPSGSSGSGAIKTTPPRLENASGESTSSSTGTSPAT